MAQIRIMEAAVETFYAKVNVPFMDTTFLPRDMLGVGDIYCEESTARALLLEARTDIEKKDYSRYMAVLKWIKTCGGNTGEILLCNNKEKYIQITAIFYDIDSLVDFSKNFSLNVKSATI